MSSHNFKGKSNSRLSLVRNEATRKPEVPNPQLEKKSIQIAKKKVLIIEKCPEYDITLPEPR